jgi:hypothetical protein
LTSDSVQASSDNGSIRLELANAPHNVNASSDNGSIIVVLPQGDEVYAVDVATDNGSTDNRLRTDVASDRHVVARTNNGNVTLRYVD